MAAAPGVCCYLFVLVCEIEFLAVIVRIRHMFQLGKGLLGQRPHIPVHTRHGCGDLAYRPASVCVVVHTVEMPTRAHVGDACFDLRAHIPDVSFHEWNGGVEVKETKGIKIRPGETVMVPTGIATEIPAGFFAPIFARSGLASKQGLRPAQGTCVIDSGYRGEWMIPLHNDSAETAARGCSQGRTGPSYRCCSGAH